MLFPTIRFALLFMATWAVFISVRDRPVLRRLVLLGASWIFYASWNWRFLALLWTIIGVSHVFARLVAGARSDIGHRLALGSGVTIELGILGYFKYYGFFSESLVDLFERFGMAVSVPLVQIVLPLGISFLTFEAVSYLIEVHRRVLPPAPLLDEAVWLSFFPTLVSGPITRASELVPQLRATPVCDEPAEAFGLIARGLFKKVVVASYLGSAIVDDAFATPSQFSSSALLFAVYAYGAQLYVDFSGYTDMARGIALLLGYRLPENFAAPYRAETVQEFWSRWHMSLTRWLRDFLFTPLGLRWGRRPVLSLAIPVVVMLLAGLWHGAAWTFVAFGAVHGLALAGERWQRAHRRRRGLGRPSDAALARIGRHVRTLHIISLGWLLFRAESLDGAWFIVERIATAGGGVSQIPVLAVATAVAVVAVQFVPARWYERWWDTAVHVGAPLQVAGIVAALTAVDVLGPTGIPPFIYFEF